MRKVFYSLVFLMVLLFATLPPIFQLVPNVNANPDWLSGWQYRKSHVITNATGAGTNYQIRIKVHYGNNSGYIDSVTFVSRSGDVDAHQGVCSDGTYLYTVEGGTSFSESKIKKWDKNWNLQQTVTVPDNSYDTDEKQLNSLCYKDGKLYIGANNYNNIPKHGWIFVYNASDLSYVEKHQVKDYYCEGCDYHDGYWWVVYDGWNYVSKYDSNWNWIADYPLESGGDLQGIRWKNNYIYVNNHAGASRTKLDCYKWTGSGFELVKEINRPSERCTQGISFDPSETDVMWWAERSYNGISHDDRVVKTTINMAPDSGEDSGEDVWLNEHCKTDFSDIRFTRSDGTTLLDYWMEEKIDSEYAIFWVKIPDDLSSSDVTIYIYYGKSDATYTNPTQHGENTFLFFDDFEGTSLDTDKWVTRQGSIGVDGNGNLKLVGTSGTRGLIDGKTAISIGAALHTKAKCETNTAYKHHWCSLRKSNDWNYRAADLIGYSVANKLAFQTWDAGSSTGTSDIAASSLDSWHKYKVIWRVDPEPSHGSWGTEETPPPIIVELTKPFSLTFSLLHQTNFQIPLTYTFSTTFTNKLQAFYNVLFQFNPVTTFIILLQATYGVLLSFAPTVTFIFTTLANYIIDFVFQPSVTFTELMQAAYSILLNFAPTVTYTLNNIANYVINFIFQPSVNFVSNIIHTISEGITYFVDLTFTPIVTFTNMLQTTYNVILDFTPLVTFTNLLQTFYQVLLNFPANVAFTLNMIAGYFVNFIFQPTVTFTLNILYQAFTGIHYFVDLVFTPIITWSLGTFQTAFLWFHNPTNILIAGLVIFTACFLLYEFSKWRW